MRSTAETISWTLRFGRPTRVSREMHFDALVHDPLGLTGELDFWTSAFELFVAGIRSWESGLRPFLGIGGWVAGMRRTLNDGNPGPD